MESDDSKAVASSACLYSPAGLQLTRCGSRRRRGGRGQYRYACRRMAVSLLEMRYTD